MNFKSFETAYMSPDQSENFEKWDDYIEWEAWELGLNSTKNLTNRLEKIELEEEKLPKDYFRNKLTDDYKKLKTAK